ncbi:methyl-accepting chemotaxis protein [Aquabacterium sp.]|uniref:methyl-accepting chemotaxis protein n=1 Tax=Aquabacterium sp. TaxID=1872578 RepID=UPI002BB2B2D4|nr:methyl-accepting chemotaxis protein [Aquabacterium sp.]HSW07743.1 methyl-accepting chemotaxis protein [Aquabacterium sp.]
MNLNQLRLGPRLALGFGLVLALVAAIAALGWSRLASTLDEVTAGDHLQRHAANAGDWRALTQLNVTRTLAIAKARGSEEVNSFLSPQMKDTSARISAVQKALETEIITPQGKALIADIARLRKTYIAQRDVIFAQLKAQDPGAWQAIEQQLLPSADAYVAAITKFQQHQQGLADEQTAATTADAKRAQWLLASLALMCLVLGAGAAWVITRSVTRPLRDAVAATQRIAAGDLSQPVAHVGRDEVGDMLGGLAEMQQSLRKLVGEVHQATDSIRTASSEVADGSLDLSSRTEQAAASLQQTASSMEQISTTVRHTAESAQTANALAASASKAATQGGQVVAQVVTAMEDISNRSKQIGDITGLIDTIAFQTNILALNAAVEAARAGEQGRGFAVVAGEVRTLAQRAADAAHEIKALIGSSVDTVDAGARLVQDAGSVMSEIVSSVQRVSGIVNEITTAAGEQSTGIGQVNVAVNQLDQMTQQNAALVEESAAAAASLQEQAARLARLMGVFKLDATPPHAVAAT